MKNNSKHIDNKFNSKIKESFENVNTKAPAFDFSTIEKSKRDSIDDKISESFNNQKSIAPAFNFNKISTDSHGKKIAESFNNLRAEAPAFNFNKIDNLSDVKHYDKVKTSFNAKAVKAPAHIWNKIDRALDIDSVWKSIIPNLTPNQFNSRRLLISAVAAILFLFIPLNLSDLEVLKFSNNSKTAIQIKNNFIDKKFVAISYNNSSEKVIVENKKSLNNFKPFAKSNKKVFKNEPSLEQKNRTVLKESPKSDNSSNYSRLIISEKNSRTNISINFPELEIQPKQEYPKKLEIGIIGGVNYTRINNNDVRASRRKSSLYSSQLSFGEFYGITTNYNLNRIYSISSEFMLNSKSTQKNAHFSGGHLNKSVTEINYHKLSILINRKFARFSTQKSDLKFGVGPYLALNKNSISSVNDKINSLNSGFKQFDLGLKTKLFYERSISNFVISYGLATEIGLLNINKGNSYVPSYLNVTSIFNIGGFVEIRYKF